MSVVNKKYFSTQEFLKVYYKLIRTAQKGKVVYYEDIARIMQLPARGDYMAREVGQMLGEISEWEHNQGRPMLSGVVIRKDKEIPGEGFFTLAKQLKIFKGRNKQSLWQKELKDVYNAWS